MLGSVVSETGSEILLPEAAVLPVAVRIEVIGIEAEIEIFDLPTTRSPPVKSNLAAVGSVSTSRRLFFAALCDNIDDAPDGA